MSKGKWSCLLLPWCRGKEDQEDSDMALIQNSVHMQAEEESAKADQIGILENRARQLQREAIKHKKDGDVSSAKRKLVERHMVTKRIEKLNNDLLGCMTKRHQLEILADNVVSTESSRVYVDTIRKIATNKQIDGISELTNNVSDAQTDMKEFIEQFAKMTTVLENKSASIEEDIERELAELDVSDEIDETQTYTTVEPQKKKTQNHTTAQPKQKKQNGQAYTSVPTKKPITDV